MTGLKFQRRDPRGDKKNPRVASGRTTASGAAAKLSQTVSQSPASRWSNFSLVSSQHHARIDTVYILAFWPLHRLRRLRLLRTFLASLSPSRCVGWKAGLELYANACRLSLKFITQDSLVA